eukprot:3933208-Rhodomonas_salina.1
MRWPTHKMLASEALSAVLWQQQQLQLSTTLATNNGRKLQMHERFGAAKHLAPRRHVSGVSWHAQRGCFQRAQPAGWSSWRKP